MSQIFNSYLLSTTQFDDFDEMAEVAAHAWDQRYRKLGKKSDYGFARQLNMPAAQLSHIGWESGIYIETGTPPGSVGIVQQVAGEKRLRMNGQRLNNDEIALLHSPHEYDLVNADGTTYMVLAVDAERLQRHVEAHWGKLPKRFELLSTLVSDTRIQQKHLSTLLRQHIDVSYDNPELLSDPAIQDVMIDELLDAVFLSSRAPTSQKSPAQRHLLARRAAQYLKDNAKQVVTLRSMCEHVGASERSLRQGFLERFGVTPKTYIKRYRLLRLNGMLRASSPEELSVTKGALSLGLTHLGRLSCEYRALFGELPSETLGRIPGSSESEGRNLADFG
jgi:AraC-like DNA-binding protein